MMKRNCEVGNMKQNLIKRCAALLGAVCTMLPVLAVSASAEADSSELLPSGKSIEFVKQEMHFYTSFNNNNSDELVAELPYASFETIVFRGDEILFTGCYGDADRENHIPADENTVYEWGSISKTMTWVSVMQLWEQGLIDLEADIRTYLPEGFLKHLRYDDPITMLDLMNHTGGWSEPTYGFGTTDADKILPLDEALQSSEPAQVFRPGEVEAYSNWGASLAAYIVERVSGEDYCDYVHAHIFEPLGMEHTAIAADHSDNPWVQERRAAMKSYQVSFMGTVKALGSCLTYIMFYPAGSATGTIGDLARYAQAFVDDSAPLFQHPETQAKMLSGSAFFGESDIPTSCHGFASVECAVRTIGHNGATFGYESNMLFDPESKVGMVCVTNDPNGNTIMMLLPELVFGTLSPEKYGSRETAEPVSFRGNYLASRDIHAGILKFKSYIGAQNMGNVQKLERIGTNVYQSNDPAGAGVIGSMDYSDGRFGIQLGSMDYIQEKFYTPKLCLFAAYVMAAIAAAYLLRIKHKIKKAGKWQRSTGDGFRTAAQFAKIVSVLLITFAAAIYTIYYGLPKSLGAVIGIVQMVCIVLCAAAALFSVQGLMKSPEMRNKLRFACNIAGNAIAAGAIIFFEMYQFWGC